MLSIKLFERNKRKQKLQNSAISKLYRLKFTPTDLYVLRAPNNQIPTFVSQSKYVMHVNYASRFSVDIQINQEKHLSGLPDTLPLRILRKKY